jgi:hypothetical protein
MPELEILNPKSNSVILDEDDLKHFCQSNNLPYSLIDLTELEQTNTPYTFIHTGAEKNAHNGGNVNHWMFLYGNNLFDSYGLQDDFIVPEWVNYVKTRPARLQEYGSNVCGEYCCVFYKFVASGVDQNDDSIGLEFSDSYGFSQDRNRNDRLIQALYLQEGGRKLEPPSSHGEGVDEITYGGEMSKPQEKRQFDSFYLLHGLSNKYLKPSDVQKLFGAHDKKDFLNRYYYVLDKLASQTANSDLYYLIEKNRKAFEKDAKERYTSDSYELLDEAKENYSNLTLTNSHEKLKPYFDFLASQPPIQTSAEATAIPRPAFPPTSPPDTQLPPGQPAPSVPDPTAPLNATTSESVSGTSDNNMGTVVNTNSTTIPPVNVVPDKETDSNGVNVDAEAESILKPNNPLFTNKPTNITMNTLEQPVDSSEFVTTTGPNSNPAYPTTLGQTQGPTSVGAIPGQMFDVAIPTAIQTTLGWGYEMPPIPADMQLLYPSIPKQAFTTILPNPETRIQTGPLVPSGPQGSTKRPMYDGTMVPNTKKIKGIVQGFEQVTSYVPLPQQSENVDIVPFQKHPIAIQTAVPQVLTMDKGLYKAGQNMLAK